MFKYPQNETELLFSEIGRQSPAFFGVIYTAYLVINAGVWLENVTKSLKKRLNVCCGFSNAKDSQITTIEPIEVEDVYNPDKKHIIQDNMNNTLERFKRILP